MSSKEATVYILDVGTTMRTKREGKNVTRLEETKDILLKLLANKVTGARTSKKYLQESSIYTMKHPSHFVWRLVISNLLGTHGSKDSLRVCCSRWNRW